MDNDETRKLSRRRFVEMGLLAGAVAPAASASPASNTDADSEHAELERLVALYGGELSKQRKVR